MFSKSKQPAAPGPEKTSKGPSVLGPTLTFIGGELSSDEDLVIEGTVEGRIAHQSHHLTIGKSGRVKADVKARMITVQGTLEGDLHGDEAVHITSTARVKGNVVSPRVSMEDGATFEGGISTTRKATLAAPISPADKASKPSKPAQTEAPAPAVAGLAGSVGVRARRLGDRAETG